MNATMDLGKDVVMKIEGKGWGYLTHKDWL